MSVFKEALLASNRPPGWNMMRVPMSPDLFGFTDATSNVGAGVCAFASSAQANPKRQIELMRVIFIMACLFLWLKLEHDRVIAFYRLSA